MNYFFHLHTGGFKSTLTIPKFRNSGFKDLENCLYTARIVNDAWKVSICDSTETTYFWSIRGNEENQDDIYFIAREHEAQLIEKCNPHTEISISK